MTFVTPEDVRDLREIRKKIFNSRNTQEIHYLLLQAKEKLQSIASYSQFSQEFSGFSVDGSTAKQRDYINTLDTAIQYYSQQVKNEAERKEREKKEREKMFKESYELGRSLSERQKIFETQPAANARENKDKGGIMSWIKEIYNMGPSRLIQIIALIMSFVIVYRQCL